jgi:hypothetical protein
VAPGDLLEQDSVPPEHAPFRAALDPALGEAYGARRAFEIGLSALLAGLRVRHAAGTGPFD